MNIVNLFAQLHSMWNSDPPIVRLQKRSRLNYRKLSIIKKHFSKHELYDPSIDQLCALIYSYDQAVKRMDSYRYDMYHIGRVKNNLDLLDEEIQSTLKLCYSILNDWIKLKYRHSV